MERRVVRADGIHKQLLFLVIEGIDVCRFCVFIQSGRFFAQNPRDFVGMAEHTHIKRIDNVVEAFSDGLFKRKIVVIA